MRPTREKQLNKQRRGTSTVEFAITLPVFLLMIMLTFEISRMMMVQQCMNYAAQEGSRAASLATTLNSTQVDTAVRNALRATINDSSNTSTVGVAVTPTMTAAIASGTPVTVNVQVQYSDVSWLPGNFLNYLGNPTLTAQSIQDRE